MSAREQVALYLKDRMESALSEKDLATAESFHCFLDTVERMSDEQFEGTGSDSADWVIA